MPSSRPVRLGLVGCGEVARQCHLPALARVPEVRVVALADAEPHRLEAAAAAVPEASRHGSAEALVADPAVEAVAVLVPPVGHRDVAATVLDAGRALFVEKPLALSLREADDLVERGRRAGVPAMVGFNLRWLAALRRARDLVAEGRLGEIEAVQTTLTSRRRLDPGNAEWRARPELGGGALVEQGIHHLDLWRFLLGDEVDEVFALTHPNHAGAVVTGRSHGGVLLQSAFSERTVPTGAVTVLGRRAAARVTLARFDGLELLPVQADDSAFGVRARGALRTLRTVPRAFRGLRAGGEYGASYAEQWRRFAAAVRDGEPASASLADGRAALAIALAAAASAASGAPERVGEPVAEATG